MSLARHIIESPFQFNGHETFPLRQLWLSKVARLINESEPSKGVLDLSTEDAIVALGVGKNMCSAIRFWADACGVIDGATMRLSKYGRLIYGDEESDGLDPCTANIATQWFVHWRLASTPDHFTPIWYLFNAVTAPTLDRETFRSSLEGFVSTSGRKVATGSIKRGVEVALRSYAPKMTGKGHMEDFIEPLLADLELIVPQSRDVFSFHRGTQPTLPDALFAFALLEFWERLPHQTSSLDFGRIAFDYGSPGKVFKLDSDGVNDRLARIADVTDEALIWTEQAGLKQVVRRGAALERGDGFKMALLRKAYA